MANASRNFGWLWAKEGNLSKDTDNFSDAARYVLQIHYKALPWTTVTLSKFLYLSLKSSIVVLSYFSLNLNGPLGL